MANFMTDERAKRAKPIKRTRASGAVLNTATSAPQPANTGTAVRPEGFKSSLLSPEGEASARQIADELFEQEQQAFMQRVEELLAEKRREARYRELLESMATDGYRH